MHAIARPRGWPEAVVAVPAAVAVIAIGAIPLSHVRDELARLAPAVALLAAVLVLGQLCDDEGLFDASGALIARSSAGRPQLLLVQVFGLAAATTAVLSLDATIVLLTPVVFATAVRLQVRPKPHLYACTHVANSGSLLLPVSNLTNLLAFARVSISFTRFAALMAVPWLVAVATEYLVFRRYFASELVPRRAVPPQSERRALPAFALAVLGLTLAGFVVTSFVGMSPVWAAFAGAAVLAGWALARGHTRPRALLDAASLPLVAFVFALGVLVRAVMDNGLATEIGRLVPAGAGLVALLGVAMLAALLANLVNNLPATLVLLPLAARIGTGSVLAVVIGVNIGPNLTYVGSLATLLWRRVLRRFNTGPELAEFTRLGLLTVPVSLVAAVLALWAALRIIGG